MQFDFRTVPAIAWRRDCSYMQGYLPHQRSWNNEEISTIIMSEPHPNFLLPRSAGALCGSCRVVAEFDGEVTYLESHLKISAARGCALCRTLFEDLVYNVYTTPDAKRYLSVTRKSDEILVLDYNTVMHTYEVLRGQRRVFSLQSGVDTFNRSSSIRQSRIEWL